MPKTPKNSVKSRNNKLSKGKVKKTSSKKLRIYIITVWKLQKTPGNTLKRGRYSKLKDKKTPKNSENSLKIYEIEKKQRKQGSKKLRENVGNELFTAKPVETPKRPKVKNMTPNFP